MDKLKTISGRILVFASAISLILIWVTGLGHAAAQDDRTVALSNVVVSWGEPRVLDRATGDPTEVPAGEPAVAGTAEPTQQPTEETDGPQIDEPSDDARDDMGGNDNDVPYAGVGMVGTRTYESPQYGVDIEWTRDWELDEDFGPAVESDPKTETDTVHLLWTAEWSAWIAIYIFDSYNIAIPDLVENYTANIPYGDAAEVVLSDASSTMGGIVTIIDEGEAYPTLIYDEIRYGPGRDSLVVIQLISLDPNVTDGIIRAARNDISIDGEPALSFFHPNDVGDIHEDGGDEPDDPTLDIAPQAIDRLAGIRLTMRHRAVTPPSRSAVAAPTKSRVRTCLTGSRGLT